MSNPSDSRWSAGYVVIPPKDARLTIELTDRSSRSLLHHNALAGELLGQERGTPVFKAGSDVDYERQILRATLPVVAGEEVSVQIRLAQPAPQRPPELVLSMKSRSGAIDEPTAVLPDAAPADGAEPQAFERIGVNPDLSVNQAIPLAHWIWPAERGAARLSVVRVATVDQALALGAPLDHVGWDVAVDGTSKMVPPDRLPPMWTLWLHVTTAPRPPGDDPARP